MGRRGKASRRSRETAQKQHRNEHGMFRNIASDNSSDDEDQYQFIVFDENDVEVNRFLLQWNEVSDTTGIKRKGSYTGHSRTSVWRMIKAAKGPPKLLHSSRDPTVWKKMSKRIWKYTQGLRSTSLQVPRV